MALLTKSRSWSWLLCRRGSKKPDITLFRVSPRAAFGDSEQLDVPDQHHQRDRNEHENERQRHDQNRSRHLLLCLPRCRFFLIVGFHGSILTQFREPESQSERRELDSISGRRAW